MRPSEYRSRVRFEIPLTVPDGRGGKTGSWTEHCWEYAGVEHTQSMTKEMEVVSAGSIVGSPVVRIHVYSNSLTRAINPQMRAVDMDTGRIMNIQTLPKDMTGNNEFLAITAREAAPV